MKKATNQDFHLYTIDGFLDVRGKIEGWSSEKLARLVTLTRPRQSSENYSELAHKLAFMAKVSIRRKDKLLPRLRAAWKARPDLSKEKLFSLAHEKFADLLIFLEKGEWDNIALEAMRDSSSHEPE